MKKVVQIFTVSLSIRFLEGLSEQLKKAGYELIVVCADGQEARDGEEKGQFKYYPVEMKRGINPVKNLKAWVIVYHILKKEKPDIVHGNTPIGGLLGLSAAWVLSVENRVFTLHGLKYPGEQGIKRVVVKFFEKLSISLATKVFAVSKGLCQYVYQEDLAPESKISVLHHGSVKGIDIGQSAEIRLKGQKHYEDILGLRSGRFRFGYFGRITEEKGIPELVEALSNLLKEGKQFDVIFCGTMELRNSNNIRIFNEFIKKKGMSMYGMVANPLEFMMCCDCIVLPTHREGFGLVNIEANSLGIPVITTDVMGCKDSIENFSTGLFFEPKNIEDLSRKLDYMYTNKNERKRMGKNGISRTEKYFDRRDIWKKLIAEYDSMTT